MFTILGADGKEYGPVTAETVGQWIAAGRANAQTQARREGETVWKTLGEFAEFAAAAPGAPPSVAAAGTTPGANLAGRGARLAAQLLDGLIAGLCVLPGCAVLYLARSGNQATTLAGLAVMGLAFLGLLVVQLYLLSTCGQTIGKKLLRIRIAIHGEGANPGFVKAVLLRVIVNALIGAIPFVGIVYSLIDICFIFRDDRRCIHDLIAGTEVVNA